MTPRRLIEPARLASTALLRGQSDARLVDLTRAGNQQAFEAIVHRYRRPLLRYCGRILPPGRAEDAVQQAFLSAYRAIRDGDNELMLRPWLYRVARNSALNLLRQNGWDHEQLHEGMDGVMRPDQAVEGRERIQSLVASVKDLPERQRDAIVLRELEGRSYEEIAVALGVTDGAVRQLLNRARTTLRAGATALTPYGLAERLGEIAGGAGGVASLAKVGAAVLVVGAVATGGTDRVLLSHPDRDASRQHAATGHRAPATDSRSPFAVRRSPFAGHAAHSVAQHTRRSASRHAVGGQRHQNSAFAEDLGTRDDHSGSSGGDSHSGSSGSDGSSSDGGGSGGSSGPGSGDQMTTSSGDGSGSSGSGSSGSGTSGSDSSGSGSSDSGTSGSGSSDGGSLTTTTSGSSGSSDGGSTTTTSGGGISGGSH